MSSSVQPTLYTDTGVTPSITDGGTTNDQTIELRGTAEAGSFLEVFGSATITPTSIPIGANLTGGEWSFTTPTLSDGSYILGIRITDPSGIASIFTSPQFTVDTQDPIASITSRWALVADAGGPIIGNPGSDSLPINTGQPFVLSRASSINFAGTVSADAEVDVYDDRGFLGRATKDATGTLWNFQTPELVDGPNTLYALATDAAGNIGEIQRSREFILDTTVSVATLTTELAPYTYFNQALHQHYQWLGISPKLRLSGMAESGSTIEIYDNGLLIGSVLSVPPPLKKNGPSKVPTQTSSADDDIGIAWEIDVPALGIGRHELIAKVTDLYGNVAYTRSISTIATPYFGDSGKNRHTGTSGDDALIGFGGADTLIGGAGNDLIITSDLAFVKLDGGMGHDTFRLTGSNLALDLQLTAGKLTGMETIDISRGIGNSVTLDFFSAIRELGANPRLVSPNPHPLMLTIDANSDDAVILKTAGANWTEIDLGPTDPSSPFSYTSYLVHGEVSENTSYEFIVRIGDTAHLSLL